MYETEPSWIHSRTKPNAENPQLLGSHLDQDSPEIEPVLAFLQTHVLRWPKNPSNPQIANLGHII